MTVPTKVIVLLAGLAVFLLLISIAALIDLARSQWRLRQLARADAFLAALPRFRAELEAGGPITPLPSRPRFLLRRRSSRLRRARPDGA